MKIRAFFPPFFILFVSAALLAAEPETPETPAQASTSANTTPDAVTDTPAAAIPAAPDEPVIPRRELKFDASEEEVPLPLDNMQQGMLDQRYVAAFRFVFTKKTTPKERVSETDAGRRTVAWPLGSGKSMLIGNVDGLASPSALDLHRISPRVLPIDRLNSFETLERELMECQYNMLLGRASYFSQNRLTFPKGFFDNSKDQRLLFDRTTPSSRLRRFPGDKESITANIAALNTTFIRNDISLSDESDPKSVEIRLLAPTSEEAKSSVNRWLGVYEWAICYPGQKSCLEMREKIIQTISEYSDQLKNAEAELKTAQQEQDKYKEFEDITPEALTTLTSQRRMLEVDLAGIKARIDACQQMLAKANMPLARLDQIETAKVTAEIELRGLNAKQAEIDRIIQGAQKRQELVKAALHLPTTVAGLKNRLDFAQKAIQAIDDYRLGYVPLPIEDNRVTIRRIKWVSPPKTEKAKSDPPSQ
jgi:hypothetical protein